MEALKPLISDYVTSHDLVYQALLETFIRFANDRLSLYGKDELFSHPEFKNDSEKLLGVLKLLNDQTIFKEMECEDEEKITLHVGDIKDNPNVSVVTAKFKLGEDSENTIALVGPTRMDYDKAMSALKYLAEELEQYFKNGGDDHGGEA